MLAPYRHALAPIAKSFMPTSFRTTETARVRARRLRRDMTAAEKLLWNKLRNRQLDDHHFRRQVPIGRFVTDFCCLRAKLIVEVDGGQHADNSHDIVRTVWLQNQGYRVLRFWNNDVSANIEGVVETIRASLSAPAPTQPSP